MKGLNSRSTQVNIKVSAHRRCALSSGKFNGGAAYEGGVDIPLVYENLIEKSLPSISTRNTVDGSIGIQHARVIFGDMVNSDLAMDLREGTTF